MNTEPAFDLHQRFHPTFGVLCGMPAPPLALLATPEPDEADPSPAPDAAPAPAPAPAPKPQAKPKMGRRPAGPGTHGERIRRHLLEHHNRWQSLPEIMAGLGTARPQTAATLVQHFRLGLLERRGTPRYFEYRVPTVSGGETGDRHNTRLDPEQDPTVPPSRARLSRQTRSTRP